MRDPALSIEAKGIYAYLSSFADEQGQCYPNIATILDEIGMSKTRYYKYLNELKKCRVLTIEEGNRIKGSFAHNTYHIIQPFPDYEETAPFPQNKETPFPHNKETAISSNCAKPFPQNEETNIPFNRPSLKQPIKNTYKSDEPEKRVAMERICKILNSRRGKRNLKTSVGLWMLDKPPGGTWADLIPLARAFVGQYPKPDDSLDNNYTITWDQFSDFLKRRNTKNEC